MLKIFKHRLCGSFSRTERGIHPVYHANTPGIISTAGSLTNCCRLCMCRLHIPGCGRWYARCVRGELRDSPKLNRAVATTHPCPSLASRRNSTPGRATVSPVRHFASRQFAPGIHPFITPSSGEVSAACPRTSPFSAPACCRQITPSPTGASSDIPSANSRSIS
jgi:hypothetical protein